jgi:hypothetical protein
MCQQGLCNELQHSYDACRVAVATKYTPHVTRHTSHVAPHTTHVTPHTSYVTRHTSHVTRHTSHVTRLTSHVTHHTSHVPRHAPFINLTLQRVIDLRPCQALVVIIRLHQRSRELCCIQHGNPKHKPLLKPQHPAAHLFKLIAKHLPLRRQRRINGFFCTRQKMTRRTLLIA